MSPYTERELTYCDEEEGGCGKAFVIEFRSEVSIKATYQLVLQESA
ncbi:hypothetical protein [Hahella sp. KA22]|nr:hypothetical protein [Hahella sp. KA22]